MVEPRETGDHAVIEVEDNGARPAGADGPADRALCDHAGGGTGLGLAIVKKIMEEHGGMLTLGNRAAGGASRRPGIPGDAGARWRGGRMSDVPARGGRARARRVLLGEA